MLALVLAAGCGRSGVPLGGADDGWPRPEFRATATPLPAIVWHSWNVEILSGSGPHAMVLDEQGEVTAILELYESGADLSAQPGTSFDGFDATHPDVASQDVGTIRSDDSSKYPYIGKNLTARAAPADPAPAGVFDLQFHPPQNGHYAIAAFVAPIAGRYVISDFAARRILADSGTSWSGVALGSDPSNLVSDVIAATEDRLWVSHAGGDVDLGDLPENERICLGTYRSFDLNNFADATELSFTITLQP